MKTLLLFVILITTLIGDDVYPNDFHIYSDFTNVIHINETNKVSFTKMEEIVNHRIKSVDLDFKRPNLSSIKRYSFFGLVYLLFTVTLFKKFYKPVSE